MLPARDLLHRLHGKIIDAPGMPNGEITLQFYDESTGVLVQTTSGVGRSYLVELPPGKYRSRADLSDPVGGFHRVYGLGSMQIEEDRRWDIDLSSATAVEEEMDTRPESYALEQNFPNPFNPSTIIRYRLPVSDGIELAVFNLIGQRVITLVKETQEAATYTVRWDGRDGPWPPSVQRRIFVPN